MFFFLKSGANKRTRTQFIHAAARCEIFETRLSKKKKKNSANGILYIS